MELDKERQDFEAWYVAEMVSSVDGDLDQDRDGYYYDMATQKTWRGWQARAASPGQELGEAAYIRDLERLISIHQLNVVANAAGRVCFDDVRQSYKAILDRARVSLGCADARR